MKRFIATVTSGILLVFVTPVMADPSTSLYGLRLVTRSEKVLIPYEVKYVFNRDIAPGRCKKTVNGKDGSKVVTVHEVVKKEKVLSSKKSSVLDPAPKSAIIEMGKGGYSTSRGGFTRAWVRDMESTAYRPTDGSGAGLTATGRKARYGVVAVDPRVIPLHSLVFVEGYGFAVAADTGGAIKGNIIDVCLPTLNECRNWGRRNVRVHVFREKLGRKE